MGTRIIGPMAFRSVAPRSLKIPFFYFKLLYLNIMMSFSIRIENYVLNALAPLHLTPLRPSFYNKKNLSICCG